MGYSPQVRKESDVTKTICKNKPTSRDSHVLRCWGPGVTSCEGGPPAAPPAPRRGLSNHQRVLYKTLLCPETCLPLHGLLGLELASSCQAILVASLRRHTPAAALSSHFRCEIGKVVPAGWRDTLASPGRTWARAAQLLRPQARGWPGQPAP